MNAERQNGSLTLSREGLTLKIDERDAPAGGVPSEVIVGIRPEHTLLWRDGAGLIGPIEGRAGYVEMLGREMFIGVTAPGEVRFTVHAAPDAAVRPGETVRFGLEPRSLYLFDAETERALTRA